MTDLQRQLARLPTAFLSPSKFVNDLPKVSRTDLPDNEHDRRCSICQEYFRMADQDAKIGEEAVRLSCGHVFGKHCLLSFLSVHTEDTDYHRPTCPMCRTQLPQLVPLGSDNEEDCARFLIWISRHDSNCGAALDRESQALQAIAQASVQLVAFPQWCHHINGGLSTHDYLYMHHLHCIINLDTRSSEAIEKIQERLDELMLQYREQPFRSAPVPLLSGRRPKIMRIVAYNSKTNGAEVGLEDGEIWEGATCKLGIPEDGHIDTSVWPTWTREAFVQDFASVPEDQVWNELRSRRFASNVMSGWLDGRWLMELASHQINDEILQEYARDTAFRESPPRREYHWQLNDASDTLEFCADYY